MTIYIFGTLLSMFFAFIATNRRIVLKSYNISFVFAYLSAVPLTCIAGFRFLVGSDYISYFKYFKLLLNGGNNDYFEEGFYWLTKSIQIFTNNYVYYFLILAIIFSFFTFKAIYKESPNPVFSIFLLVSTQYFFIYMNGMRQFISLAIFLYSIRFIKERNFLKYLVCILLGGVIHNSVFILLPVYFLYGLKIKPRFQILFLIVGYLISGVISSVISSLMLNSKYLYYIESNYGMNNNGYIMMAIELSIFMLGILYMKKTNDNDVEDKTYDFLLYMKGLSFLFALTNSIFPLMYRIKWCFGFSTIIFIPMIIERIKEKNPKLSFMIKTAIYFLFTVYILYTVGVQNANDVLPYNSIFDLD